MGFRYAYSTVDTVERPVNFPMRSLRHFEPRDDRGTFGHDSGRQGFRYRYVSAPLYRPTNSQCEGFRGDAATATNAPHRRIRSREQTDVTRRDPSETRSVRNCSPHSDTLGSATVLLQNATRASATDSGSEPCAPSGNGNPTMASSSSTNRKKRSETDGSLRPSQKAFKFRISACVGPEASESVGTSGSISGRRRRIKLVAVAGFGDERKT